MEWLQANVANGSTWNSFGDTRWWERPKSVSTASSWLQAADRFASREGVAGEEREEREEG